MFKFLLSWKKCIFMHNTMFKFDLQTTEKNMIGKELRRKDITTYINQRPRTGYCLYKSINTISMRIFIFVKYFSYMLCCKIVCGITITIITKSLIASLVWTIFLDIPNFIDKGLCQGEYGKISVIGEITLNMLYF